MMKWFASWLQRCRDAWENYEQINRQRQEDEFLPAVLEVTETPPSPIARLILWSLMAVLALGLLWTIFGHVDEVAVATGKVIPTGQVKVIQSQYGGVVKAINVRDGQQVKEGDVLLELDETISAADKAQMRKQVAYYTLQLKRLEAERSGAPFEPIGDADLDPLEAMHQRRLYDSRTAGIRQRLAQADAKVAEQQALQISTAANLQKYSSLLVVAREQESRMKKLLDQEAVSYFSYLQYEARRIELEQNLAAQQAEIARVEATLQQALRERDTIKAERDNDIAARIVDDRKQLMNYQEELKKAEQKSRQATLTAPVNGHVTQLAVHTLGGVVTAAQALMIIVPQGTTLEVEAWAANKDIGFLHPGQVAEVKVETFNFQRYGTIDAVVANIGADAKEDKEKGNTYRIVLQLQRQDMEVGGRRVALSPGMTATAEIKIRQKRIVEYFLDPFRKYKSEALRER